MLTCLIFPVAGDPTQVPGGGTLIDAAGAGGPPTIAERRVASVFAAAALLWVCRPLLSRVPDLEGLTDPAIALICGSALFLIPSGVAADRRFLMTWREAQELPWQVLILFGGGLSLAAALDASGLALWIGRGLADLGSLPAPLFLLALTGTVVGLTELASNTAIVAALLPVVATVAAGAGMDLLPVSAAVAMAASCAFMLPVATTPNALVFATGHVRVIEMMRAGIVMNLISVMLVSTASLLLAPWLQAIE